MGTSKHTFEFTAGTVKCHRCGVEADVVPTVIQGERAGHDMRTVVLKSRQPFGWRTLNGSFLQPENQLFHREPNLDFCPACAPVVQARVLAAVNLKDAK